MSDQKAFSLIELVMSLTIIALLYKGLIGAKSLLDASYAESIVKEIKYFENATIKFYNKYKFIPGDFANISILSSSNKLIAGDEDGSISTSSEALQFWLHLKEAGLIEGNFDGYSYSLANDENIGGIPESKFATNLAYNIEINPDINKVTLIIAAFSENKKNLSYFTPSEAQNIAKLLGNNINNNSYIEVFDGEDVTKGSCLTGEVYNLSNITKACYIKYSFPEFGQIQDDKLANINYPKCEGSIIGTTRKSDNEICPINTEGSVKQICDQNGNWVNYNFDCREIKCSDLYYNETINITCSASSAGYNQFFCNNVGILEENPTATAGNNSLLNNCYANYNCYEIGKYRNIACPIDHNGIGSKWLQICATNGTWQDVIKNCIKLNLTCSLGQTRNNLSISDICPALGYVPSNIAPLEACVFTPDGVGWRLIQDNCLPNYNGNNCALNDTRTLSCPKGQTGYIQQICNAAGYYETTQDECNIVKCGENKIGSFKIGDSYNCPAGTIGQVIEVCDYEDGSDMNNATWQISYQNCQRIYCPEVYDGVGNNNYWPESPANNLIQITCSNNIDKAIRFCQSNGNWSDNADKACP